MASNRPNAHIEAWLAEWRDEAKAKGHQSQHTFAKALISIRAYPLPLTSGNEAAILKNFGPALCQMIDKRLKEEKKNPTATLSQPADSWDNEIAAAPKAKTNKAKPSKHVVQEVNRDLEDGSENSGSPQVSPKKRARVAAPRQPKEYIPAFRSGGFAILIALLEHSRDPAVARSYLTKTELIEAAQPNCDTSFKPQARGGMPTGPNAFFYTAWSSMSTLIKKLLVLKEGNPARYTLTENGKQLAERLQAGITDSQNEGTSSQSEGKMAKPIAKPPAPKKASSSNSASARILSTYVKADDDSSSDEDGSRPVGASKKKPAPLPRSNSTKTTSSSQPATQTRTVSSSQPVATTMARTLSTASTSSNNNNFVPKMVRASSTASTASSRQPLLADSALIDETYQLLASKTDSSGNFPWEVVLCVDNQEYYGTSSKKNLITDLMKLGVRTEVRRLSVGDYLWVLRRRPGASTGPSGEDIVLDYVMERKRIDDLVSSIVDGRFKEQKTRMKNSGRPKTIYLVEEFTAWSANTAGWRLSINPSSLLQSVMNTLVIDDFELRMTRDSHHTAVMLAALSRQIEAAINKVAAKCRSAFACSLEEKSECLTRPISAPARFGEWNAASSKSRPMTVREVFARQLMCVQGVSADRAIAITSLYPTPAALLEACSTNETECEKQLATLKIGTRKLGPAVSKRLVTFYSRFGD